MSSFLSKSLGMRIQLQQGLLFIECLSEEENVAVPKKMLEKMYQMIEKSSDVKHF